MATGQFIAYYRVSTKRQGASGLGLDAQQKSVADWLNGGRWDLVAEYTEVESGTKSDKQRPQLLAVLEHCRKAKAKLVIAKLDRLSRNVAFVSALMESGVRFIAVDLPELDSDSPMGKAMLHMMAVMAQFQRDQISENTRNALKAAKARGVKLGSPKLAQARVIAMKVRTANADDFAKRVAPVIADIERSGTTTLRGIARELNARKVLTRQERQFTPVQVKAIKDRVA